MSRLTDLIAQVEKKDASLANELRKEVEVYAKRRPFGLNFERHLPECVRLYNRPARRGDKVNILPDRGKKETVASKEKWLVKSIKIVGDKREAVLTSVDAEQEETITSPVDNLVVIAEFNEPIYPGLKETGRVERGGDKPYQVVINGENYHALETMLYAYEEKVDCIYIDPPYNKGTKDWKYNNDYVDGEDAYRHSKWLAFMERRLRLAKRLLNPYDSVLIIAIDEEEIHHLALLLEMLFASAEIQMVTTVISAKGVVRSGKFSRVEEHLLIATFGNVSISPQAYNMLEVANEKKDVREIEWLGLRRREPSSIRGARPNQFYPIFVDCETGYIKSVGDPINDNILRNTIEIPDGCCALWPLNKNGEERLWGLTAETLVNNIRDGYVKVTSWSKEKQTGTVRYLPAGTIHEILNGEIISTGRAADGSIQGYYHDSYLDTTPPKRVWNMKSHNAETYGTNIVSALIPNRRFPFPKSLYAVEDVIRFFTANKPNALIVDFFSGSGTTAHAVMRLNRQDGGCRRCICITNNEVSVAEAVKLTKQKLRPSDLAWEALGICEYITKPRITAAITGKTLEGESIKGDYKFTDEFPMADGFEENAVFYDLTYQDEINVKLDQAFEEIAPLLWMRSGSVGKCIDKRLKNFAVSETYAVLFDYKFASDFIDAIDGHDALRFVYIVTDQDSRFQDVSRRLPDGIEPIRLYESYIRSFKINQGEA